LLPRNGKCHRVDETSRKEALFVFDAGVSCYDAFAFAQAAGFSGMEFLIGIPGTIGGAVFMNAGAHGTEVKDVIEWAEVIGFFSNPLDSSDLVNGKSSNGRGIYRINKDQLAQQMQYRNGGFEPEHIIIRACFRLTAADRDVIWKRGMQLLDERARKLSPIGICCGFAGNNWNDGGGSGDGARDASGSGDGGSARGSGDGGSARGSGGGSDGASSSSNGRDSARSSSSSVDGSRNGGDSSGSDGNYNGGGRGSRNDGGRSHNHSSTRSPGPNAGIGTAGSTFKNPPEKPAWALIDEAGCRGQRLGGAAISEHHANFLINTGNATASELEDLGELVREKVFEKSGVMLQWEIRRLGERFGKSNKSRRRQ
jgi:UDP-N-acetylenolpyruvoylglucosamine reductase